MVRRRLPEIDINDEPGFRETHTGKGVDRKGTKRDGLRFRWQWIRRRMLSLPGGFTWKNPDARTPCGCCEAIVPVKALGDSRFELEVHMSWGKYEAQVHWNGENIIHTKYDCGHPTRLEAQKEAEALLEKFLIESLKVLRVNS